MWGVGTWARRAAGRVWAAAAAACRRWACGALRPSACASAARALGPRYSAGSLEPPTQRTTLSLQSYRFYRSRLWRWMDLAQTLIIIWSIGYRLIVKRFKKRFFMEEGYMFPENVVDIPVLSKVQSRVLCMCLSSHLARLVVHAITHSLTHSYRRTVSLVLCPLSTWTSPCNAHQQKEDATAVISLKYTLVCNTYKIFIFGQEYK